MKETNYNIRLIRNIAIMLVIMTHVSSWMNFYNANFTAYYFFQSISQIGCPLFLMVSGALLIQREDGILSFIKEG